MNACQQGGVDSGGSQRVLPPYKRKSIVADGGVDIGRHVGPNMQRVNNQAVAAMDVCEDNAVGSDTVVVHLAGKRPRQLVLDNGVKHRCDGFVPRRNGEVDDAVFAVLSQKRQLAVTSVFKQLPVPLEGELGRTQRGVERLRYVGMDIEVVT